MLVSGRCVGGGSGSARPADSGLQRRRFHRGLLPAFHPEDVGQSLQLRLVLRGDAGSDDPEPLGDLHPLQLRPQVVRELPEEDEPEPQLLEELNQRLKKTVSTVPTAKPLVSQTQLYFLQFMTCTTGFGSSSLHVYFY